VQIPVLTKKKKNIYIYIGKAGGGKINKKARKYEHCISVAGNIDSKYINTMWLN
jgi:hypothetical protein